MDLYLHSLLTSHACLGSKIVLSCHDVLFVENRDMIVRASYDFTSNHSNKASQHGMDRHRWIYSLIVYGQTAIEWF